jgi:hypothetical protein
MLNNSKAQFKKGEKVVISYDLFNVYKVNKIHQPGMFRSWEYDLINIITKEILTFVRDKDITKFWK